MCLQCLFLEMQSTEPALGAFGLLLAALRSSRARASAARVISASFSSSVSWGLDLALFFFLRFFLLTPASGAAAIASPSDASGSPSDVGQLPSGDRCGKCKGSNTSAEEDPPEERSAIWGQGQDGDDGDDTIAGRSRRRD